jgi:anthranilate phosphoribosyltransferase
MASEVEQNAHAHAHAPHYVSITPLLKRLWPSPAETNVTADEVALAISHIFTNQLSPVQTGALLTCLHFTGWDRRADVVAKCAEVMRGAASQIDRETLETVVKARGKREGSYQGGLVSEFQFPQFGTLLIFSV